MRYSMISVALLMLSGACSQQAAEPAAQTWERIQQGALSESAQAQLDRAVQAKEALFQRLSIRLGEVIKAEGPAAAIRVCRLEAPQMARAVAQEHHLNIGRTSFGLRNPVNKPPSWAAPLIEERPEKPVILTRGDGDLAALLPIRLQKGCLTCHGPQDQIPEEVKTALAELYPEDEATGFNEGDLRGWFWVSVSGSSGE
jgi:hypothetical protein